MIMYCTWTCYMYPACHAPKMDNPENNLNILCTKLGRGRGLIISTFCTIEKMLTIVNDP